MARRRECDTYLMVQCRSIWIVSNLSIGISALFGFLCAPLFLNVYLFDKICKNNLRCWLNLAATTNGASYDIPFLRKYIGLVFIASPIYAIVIHIIIRGAISLEGLLLNCDMDSRMDRKFLGYVFPASLISLISFNLVLALLVTNRVYSLD